MTIAVDWDVKNQTKQTIPTMHDNFLSFFSAAVLYYYFYKRSSLKLGDPRFYQESDWIRKEFEKRR